MKLNEKENLLKESIIHVNNTLQGSGVGSVSEDNMASILKIEGLKEAYFDSLLEGYATHENLSEAAYAGTSTTFDSTIHQANVENTRALMENATNAMLMESATSGGLSYYSTLTFPLIKRHMIACTAKNIIPVEVPDKPIFKRGMERLYVYNPATPEKKYEIQDVFFNSTAMTDLETALRTRKTLEIPLTTGSATVNLLESAQADKKTSAISKDFRVTQVEATVDTKTCIVKLNENIVSGLNVVKIDINEDVTPTDNSAAKRVKALIFGSLNYETGEFTVTTNNTTEITKVTVSYSISNESNFKTVAFDWGHTEREFTIPDGDHYNIALPVEYTHDAKALFGIDMQAKLTENCGTFIEHKKDKEIYEFLDASFTRLKEPFGLAAKFDLKPAPSFHGLPTEWSKVMFKKRLSQIAGRMKEALNIKDCYFAVVGNPFDIQELKDEIKWVYTDKAQMAGIKLDYKFGLIEDDVHNYTITSTRRIPQGTIKIYLIPTNDDQFTYKHFQYAFYVSNAYGNPTNVMLPNVMISDRNLTEEFTPVQTQVTILNNDVDIINRDTNNMFN